MNDYAEKTAEQAAAFQKIWVESLTKLMQTASTFSPDSVPPDVMRQIRSGIFQALAQSWEEFMRSPQFLDGMRQWMESAVAFRKMTNEFMAKARNEVQAPSRDDIDMVMLSVRHMEKRLLDRLEDLSEQVNTLNGHKSKESAPGKGGANTTSKTSKKKTSP